MRELKFRGLNEETGEWVYGYYTKLVEGIRRFDAIIADIDGELTRFYIHNPETIGQYTELKDKNGKEIYEGDICSVIMDGGQLDIGEITWCEEQLRWKWDMYGFSNSNTSRLKIIGNIHENPELFGGKEKVK